MAVSLPLNIKNTMLEDPWAECTPVPVSEVAKKVQVSTRHRYRLFQRLDQTEDNDGLLDDEEPGKIKRQITEIRKYYVRQSSFLKKNLKAFSYQKPDNLQC